MKRVIVIGSPGAGKSTFSRNLRDRTGLPLYHLDNIWHKPDRTTISREEFDERMGAILAKDRWIIDGNYSRTLELRLKLCDTVFLLDYPLEVCLAGVNDRIGKEKIFPGSNSNLTKSSGSLSWSFPKPGCPVFTGFFTSMNREGKSTFSGQEKRLRSIWWKRGTDPVKNGAAVLLNRKVRSDIVEYNKPD